MSTTLELGRVFRDDTVAYLPLNFAGNVILFAWGHTQVQVWDFTKKRWDSLVAEVETGVCFAIALNEMLQKDPDDEIGIWSMSKAETLHRADALVEMEQRTRKEVPLVILYQILGMMLCGGNLANICAKVQRIMDMKLRPYLKIGIASHHCPSALAEKSYLPIERDDGSIVVVSWDRDDIHLFEMTRGVFDLLNHERFINVAAQVYDEFDLKRLIEATRWGQHREFRGLLLMLSEEQQEQAVAYIRDWTQNKLDDSLVQKIVGYVAGDGNDLEEMVNEINRLLAH